MNELKNFSAHTLVIDSQCLEGNTLKDVPKRRHPILLPKGVADPPVVFFLPGFTGSGLKTVGWRSFENSLPQDLDEFAKLNAAFVFVDAFTSLGGSQYIDSPAVGNYEDHLVSELYEAMKAYSTMDRVAIAGSSSGGFGALHLSSKYPEKFHYCYSMAPDCYFEACYLPDLYKAIPLIKKIGGVSHIMKAVSKEVRLSGRDFHTLMNAVGMAACYSTQKEISYPLDLETGLLNQKIWNSWKLYDPVSFVKSRQKGFSSLRGLHLEVGKFDEFSLQLGANQLKLLFDEMGLKYTFEEFNGGHFDFIKRRTELFNWLKVNLNKDNS